MGKAGSGFKKPANKKKFTKKDAISFILIIVAIAAVIAIFAYVITKDDFIRTKDGRLQMDDNWLIAQYERNNGAAWYQIGEVGDIDGFYLGTESAGNSMKYIYPDDINSNVSVIYVGASYSDYEVMLSSLTDSTVASYGITEYPATTELTLAGKDAVAVHCVIPCTENLDEEAADETEETTEEATEEVTEDTAEETTEEAAEETAAHSHPGSIIFSCIKYDEERCAFIQINTVDTITDEEALSLIETVGGAITLTDR